MDDFFDSEEEEFEDIEVPELVHRYEQMIENHSTMYLSLDDYAQLFAYYMMIDNDTGMYSNHPEEVNMEMAASVLSYGMRQYPASPVLQMYRIYYKYQQRVYNIHETLELLAQVEIPEYDMLDIGFCKGRIYMAIGAASAAIYTFEKLLKFARTKGDKIDIYREIISSIRFEDEDNIDKISHYLEKIITLDPSSELEYLNQIGCDSRKVEMIFTILERYVKRHLFSKNGWLVLGKRYCYYSKYKEAAEAMNKAIALSNENDPELLVSMGNIYKSWDKKEMALEYYQEAMLHCSPNKKYSPDLLSNLADLYLDTEQLEQAAYYYNLLLEINPENQDALYCLGMIYFEQEKYDLAIHYLERARKIDMEQVRVSRISCKSSVLSLMSICMITVNRGDEMIKIYEHMSKYFFYNVEFWLVYADHYVLINNYDMALYILDMGMRMEKATLDIMKLKQDMGFTANAILLYRKANYYFIMGYTDCGILCLRRALEINPFNVQHFLEYDRLTAALPEVIELIKEFEKKDIL
jgi:tetratricopeptide (TPR) repeat protein